MKKLPSREELLNGWLKYHNTTVEGVISKHPKEVLESPDWFKLYPVTQEQYDEWESWAKSYIKECTKYTKKYINRKWEWLALDIGPHVKNE